MLLCMRTTVEINDALFNSLKRRAADEHATLRELIDRALRQYLAGRQTNEGFKLNLKPHRKGQLLPGVVLEDRNILLDVMEGRS